MGFAICYLDETGCLGALPSSPGSDIQPVFALTGALVDSASIPNLTKEFIGLKKTYFPANFKNLTHDLEGIKIEIKGSSIKKMLCGTNQNAKETAQRFMDGVFSLLNKYKIKLVSKIWVKGAGKEFKGPSIYTSSAQLLSQYFEEYLKCNNKMGLIIADNRNPHLNSIVSHCIFSKKYNRKGDPYPSILESPVFGISDNHAVLQIIDIISSAIIGPISIYKFCCGNIVNSHVKPCYSEIYNRYRTSLKRSQLTIYGTNKIYGVQICDKILRRNVSYLWAD